MDPLLPNLYPKEPRDTISPYPTFQIDFPNGIPVYSCTLFPIPALVNVSCVSQVLHTVCVADLLPRMFSALHLLFYAFSCSIHTISHHIMFLPASSTAWLEVRCAFARCSNTLPSWLEFVFSFLLAGMMHLLGANHTTPLREHTYMILGI